MSHSIDSTIKENNEHGKSTFHLSRKGVCCYHAYFQFDNIAIFSNFTHVKWCIKHVLF